MHNAINLNALIEKPEKAPEMDDHRNNLFNTKIRRQTGNQKPPNHYMLNDHVQNPNLILKMCKNVFKKRQNPYRKHI
jgi:hypothetical protein